LWVSAALAPVRVVPFAEHPCSLGFCVPSREPALRGLACALISALRRYHDAMYAADQLVQYTSTGASPWAMQAKNEVNVLAALDHPNIVQYYECYLASAGGMTIIMEFCDGGDLDGVIK
jgi:serine/threonine protein kinase